MRVNKEEFVTRLKEISSRIDSESVVFHTDILRTGFLPKASSHNEQLEIIKNCLFEVFKGKTLLFPAFNYDFTKKGVYDVEKDECQVGRLNEYVRNEYKNLRTKTPVFNFVIINNKNFNTEFVTNPFSEESNFGEMISNNTTIIFLGAKFSSNTFLLYLEDALKVPYRYIKDFPGKIIYGKQIEDINLKYRVRPLIENATDKDWNRLENEFIEHGLLNKEKIGRGVILYFNARKLYKYVKEELLHDEHYLLTSESKDILRKLYEQYGKPLKYEKIESD